MDVSKFTEKLNKIEGNSYVYEEEVILINNVYNGQLEHDNINSKTLTVYTGPKLTGNKITNYFLNTPSLAPWKYNIRIYAEGVEKVYISYTTEGDQVEADDINLLQDELIRTQESVNTEENRAINKEIEIENNLNEEIERATSTEEELAINLQNEINRAINKESEIDAELLNRYKKDETFSKEEVLQKIADLVDSAPGTLDTLKEIADALGNDPNFSTTIITMLGEKVDKEEGKGLSTNDYTDEEKQKVEDLISNKSNYDLINGSLRVAQRYDASDTTTFTNPSNKYIMDRFLCNGTGTVVPVQGGGCTVTGTINFKYWIEKLDFDLLPSKFNITYSVNGVETVLEVIKADCTVDADGNGLIFNQDITDSVLNYVHYGKGPFAVRTYPEELTLCQRYYQILALDSQDIATIYANRISWCSIFLRVPMRIFPTLAKNNLNIVLKSAAQDGFSFSIANYAKGTDDKILTKDVIGICLNADKTAHGLDKSTDIIRCNGFVHLDSDIY